VCRLTDAIGFPLLFGVFQEHLRVHASFGNDPFLPNVGTLSIVCTHTFYTESFFIFFLLDEKRLIHISGYRQTPCPNYDTHHYSVPGLSSPNALEWVAAVHDSTSNRELCYRIMALSLLPRLSFWDWLDDLVLSSSELDE
jgi:hypothetical protein